jgi:hypothetical protein
MDVIYSRCCGLDIHKKTVVACLLTSEAGQPPVTHSIGFNGRRMALLYWGSFRLDFLFLDDVWSHDLLENNFSNINKLRFYH